MQQNHIGVCLAKVSQCKHTRVDSMLAAGTESSLLAMQLVSAHAIFQHLRTAQVTVDPTYVGYVVSP
jgi:hypothetical protein